MLSLQMPWLSFLQLVVPPLIISICFFFAYLGQRKCIKRLWENRCRDGDDYDRRRAIERHEVFIARVSLSMSAIFLVFCLIMSGRILKLF